MSPSRTTLSSRLRDDPQQLVAGGVAEAVVDVLEAVDVDVQRGHRQLLAARAGEHLLGAVEREHAVGQAGERVVQRLMAKLAGLLPDHPDRALARARQHQHERGEQHVANRPPSSTTSAWSSAEGPLDAGRPRP